MNIAPSSVHKGPEVPIGVAIDMGRFFSAEKLSIQALKAIPDLMKRYKWSFSGAGGIYKPIFVIYSGDSLERIIPAAIRTVAQIEE
jgi:hypothetical protein